MPIYGKDSSKVFSASERSWCVAFGDLSPTKFVQMMIVC